MLLDISRYFLALGLLLGAYMFWVWLVFSTPSLQWGGMDDVVWPIALALLAVSTAASVITFLPKGKRAIADSPHKKSFAIGFLFVALYTVTGIGTLVLLPFRMASGI
jgi:hypothetical protein